MTGQTCPTGSTHRRRPAVPARPGASRRLLPAQLGTHDCRAGGWPTSTVQPFADPADELRPVVAASLAGTGRELPTSAGPA
ncbi:hypothetical protein [Kineococcus aurantiacus]|uniref:Uncharacterized protein n=1 Tax=Kineococcus aurantiacus TaxID=37633 RepID=A0A7Y9DMN2_9ACTN|nr:hypothetical protein [Kineococcus aurantiacus]NYD23411.1 hypothetical protein [Kineococcus aurantiacus]